MKKSILFLVILISQINAQVVQIYQPIKMVVFQNPATPLVILDHFARNYPGVTPEWGLENKNYIVKYSDPVTSLGRIITYDRHGNVIRVQTELFSYAYPPSITLYFDRKYPNQSYRVWASEDNQGHAGYYSKVRSKIIWFDKDGNYKHKRFLF